MLAMAIENEVVEYIAEHENQRDACGYRLVVRNGHLSARRIQTGVGPIEVEQPRVNDKRIDENGQRIHFSSKILPPYLRTANPIESTFATVRLRTARTKGCGSRTACLTMVFKLAQCAERHWRRLNAKELIVEVIEGIKFVDGIKEIAA